MSSFQDEVFIQISAGKGGAGSVHFHTEKFVEFGGPDGGDGGAGGDVVFISDHRVLTLENFLPDRTYSAQDGEPGLGQNRQGKKGSDLVLKVPVGTQIFLSDTRELLYDFLKDGEEYRIAKGGRGGKGNAFFKSSTNQAPRYSQPGEDGETFSLLLQLKLIADLGIVGFPNAGKSTLLSKLTEAHPKIAGYAFTTLTPNLGIVREEDDSFRYTVADIPGIIEGASRGIGLGISFLKHIERVRGILFLFDGSNLQLQDELEILRGELKAYNETLLQKPFLLVINKSDLWSDPEFDKELESTFSHIGDVLCISAETEKNIGMLKSKIKEKFFSSAIESYAQ